MRKHTALSLFITLCLLASCSPRFTEFTFVQMTDPQIGFRDTTPGFRKSDSLFSRAVEAVNTLSPGVSAGNARGPKCVIITGDLINDAYDTLQDSIYRANRAKIIVPVYEVPGNHDIRPWNPENHAHYLQQRGYERFSFRLGGCAFIGFDSNCIKDGQEMAEEQQFKWLERELRKSRRYKYIFVFLHCPVIRECIDEENDYFNFHKDPDTPGSADAAIGGPRGKYMALFKKYGVDVVFAGHTHMDYDTTVEGIRFVTAGPVGMPLGRGYSGFEVVKVTKEGIDCRFVPTP